MVSILGLLVTVKGKGLRFRHCYSLAISLLQKQRRLRMSKVKRAYKRANGRARNNKQVQIGRCTLLLDG